MWVVKILHDLTEAIDKARLYEQLKQASVELERKVQSAIAGAWRSPSGSVAIAVASIVDDSIPLTIRIDPAKYNVVRGTRDASGASGPGWARPTTSSTRASTTACAGTRPRAPRPPTGRRSSWCRR